MSLDPRLPGVLLYNIFMIQFLLVFGMPTAMVVSKVVDIVSPRVVDKRALHASYNY